MMPEKVLWCIHNSSAYRANGECRYCAEDCEDNICECSKSSICDPSSIIGATACFAVALCMCSIAVLSSWHHLKNKHMVRSYEADLEHKQLPGWERKKTVSIGLPCVAAVFLVGGGVAMLLLRTRVD